VGYTYKVITAGTYASQAADVGDTFISDGSAWVLIPSGDEPSGTVTSVGTGVGLTGGTITSSGTVKAKLKSESSLGASNSVTTTSGKTYAVGVDSSGYLAVNVPWTDNNTTYSAATTSANGLMSSTDKSKLDGIASGAEVNQNAFSNVTVGSTTIAADSKTDTLTITAGSNITLTPDATNDKLTIAATNTNTTYSLSKSGSTITHCIGFRHHVFNHGRGNIQRGWHIRPCPRPCSRQAGVIPTW